MVIAIYLILMFLVFLFVKAFRQKITWCFSCYLTGILLILTATVLYITKFSSYSFPLSIDYSIYLWMGRIKIRVSDISRIYNIGMGLIIFVPYLIFKILGNENHMRNILLLILPLFYIIYNDYAISMGIYLAAYTPRLSIAMKYFSPAGNFLCLMLIFVSMGFTIFCFITRLRESKHFYAKRESVVCLICMLLLDLFVVAFFIVGSFREVNPFFLQPMTNPKINISENLFLMPISLMGVLVVVLCVFIYFRPFSQLVIFRKKSVYKNTKKLNKSTRMIFHTYKNSFLAISKLADFALSVPKEEYATVMEIMGKIKNSAEHSVESISEVINSLSDIKMSLNDISVKRCVLKAVRQSGIQNRVNVTFEPKCGDVMLAASEVHIVAMFENLITNAAESIRISGQEDGHISIKLDRDDKYLYIEVADNGVGIHHSEIKNIFKPLFSSKSGSKNFGLGLTYVEKVVKAHYGYINVQSRPGEETLFQILLPLDKEGEKKHEKNKSHIMR